MLSASFTTSRGVTTTKPILSTLVLPIQRATAAAAPPPVAMQRPPILSMLPAPVGQTSLTYNQSVSATDAASMTPAAPTAPDVPTDPTMQTTPSSAGTAATALSPPPAQAALSTAQTLWADVKPYAPYVVGGLVVIGVAHFVFRHVL